MDSNMRDLFLQDLLKLISIKSFTGDEKGTSQCFKLIESIAERFGFETKRCAYGMVLEVFPKNVTETCKIGVVTHVDTVPFVADEWTANPLGEIRDGRVFGRGTIDDKLGVISSLYVFKELEGQIEPSWKLIIGSMEEGQWDDMSAYRIEGNKIPEFVFTIDGDGIQNGCRGTLNLELSFRRKFKSKKSVTVFETPNGVPNTIPDQVVTCVDGKVQVVTGKAAHSSRPELGVNAITQAYKANQRAIAKEYEGFAKLMDKYIHGEFVVEQYFGETRIKTLQFVPGTTFSPTMCKLEKDHLKVMLNIRLSPKVNTKAQVYCGFFEICHEYGCQLHVNELTLPAFIEAESREIQLMRNAYEKVMGWKVSPLVALGTGYNAAFPNAAIFGPRFADVDEKDQDLCHCKDESRRIEDIEKFFEMLRAYLKESLSVD